MAISIFTGLQNKKIVIMQKMKEKEINLYTYHHKIMVILELVGCKPKDFGTMSGFTKIRYIIQPWFSLIALICGTLIIFAHAISNWGDVVEFVESACPGLSGISYCIKIIVFIINKEQVYKIVQIFHKDIWTLEIAKNRQFTILTTIFHSSVITTMSIYLAEPFTRWFLLKQNDNTTQLTLPYRAIYPFDVSHSPIFEMALFFEWLVSLYAICLFVGFDGLFFVMVFHLCGQIEILEQSFKNIKSHACLKTIPLDTHEKNRKGQYEDEEFNQFCKCIRRHVFLIDVFKDIQKVYGPLILLIVTINCLLICFTCFQASIVLGQDTLDIKRILTYPVYLGQTFFQLYMWCWCGQRLINKSLNIAHATFDSEWYDFDLKIKKCQPMVILRAQKSLRLNGLGFFTLNMESFAVILKTSLSYVALLQTIMSKDV